MLDLYPPRNCIEKHATTFLSYFSFSFCLHSDPFHLAPFVSVDSLSHLFVQENQQMPKTKMDCLNTNVCGHILQLLQGWH